jgi:MoxR-like ATPase
VIDCFAKTFKTEDVPGVERQCWHEVWPAHRVISANPVTPDMLQRCNWGIDLIGKPLFEFRPGPIARSIGDEINRATPKTQAALLEAMEERQVTVDGITHTLPRPFMVMATQNPIEYEGTFPLPEAQLDRFLMRIRLGYPSAEDEMLVLERQRYRHPIENIDKVVSADMVLNAQNEVKNIYVAPTVKRYIVDINRRTREFPEVYLGASPRGSLTLYRACQARAAVRGREYVLPDDVKTLAEASLGHRVILDLQHDYVI